MSSACVRCTRHPPLPELLVSASGDYTKRIQSAHLGCKRMDPTDEGHVDGSGAVVTLLGGTTGFWRKRCCDRTTLAVVGTAVGISCKCGDSNLQLPSSFADGQTTVDKAASLLSMIDWCSPVFPKCCIGVSLRFPSVTSAELRRQFLAYSVRSSTSASESNTSRRNLAAYTESMAHKLTPTEMQLLAPEMGDKVALRRLCTILALKAAYIHAISQPPGFDWARLEFDVPGEAARGEGTPLTGWEFRIFRASLGVEDLAFRGKTLSIYLLYLRAASPRRVPPDQLRRAVVRVLQGKPTSDPVRDDIRLLINPLRHLPVQCSVVRAGGEKYRIAPSQPSVGLECSTPDGGPLTYGAGSS
ncbi:hypothetical protein FB451DRAFT_1393967 [Mycena latifolia]|nr:hypothetical protein FB451DRAFT_1393967 [Mycena latifolia]